MSSPYVTKVKPVQFGLWQGKRRLLGKLDMELTERCNNNCIHCCINLPADDPAAQERELATTEIQGILDQAAALGCMSVRFTGGEPLLRDDLEELYLYARRLGLAVVLFTNATRLTPHLVDLLAHIPPRRPIEVSVYGMGRRTYEAISRVPGSFEAAWRGIRLLEERQVPFVAKAALLPTFWEEMDEFESWAATIPWMEGHPPSYSMFFDLRCRRDSEAKNRLIRRLRLSPAEGLQIISRDPDSYVRSMRQFCTRFMGRGGDRLFTCGAGQGISVDAYGTLQPCLLLRHPDTVYDLQAGSLEDALTGFFPSLRELRASNPDYLARCARCFLKGLCEQCPAKSWMEHGTLDTPVEYLCRIAHAQARGLDLLEAGEWAWDVERETSKARVSRLGEKDA